MKQFCRLFKGTLQRMKHYVPLLEFTRLYPPLLHYLPFSFSSSSSNPYRIISIRLLC